MSQEKLNELINYLLLGSGTGSVVVGLNVDGLTDLLTFGITLATFGCYLLINQDKIEEGWKKFRNRIKKNKDDRRQNNNSEDSKTSS